MCIPRRTSLARSVAERPHHPLAAWILTLQLALILPASALAADGRWVDFSPSSRYLHSTIYDPVGDRLILFGGANPIDLDDSFNETWELALSGGAAGRWTRLATFGDPPSPRWGQSAIYDPIRHRMIVFGGSDGLADLNEVWTLSLDGDPSWIQLAPSGGPPLGRVLHSAIYDENSDRMVIYGGLSAMDDLWALSLGGAPAWTELLPAGGPPEGRDSHSAIYDPANDRMIVFGGKWELGSTSNDLWELTLGDAPAWTPIVADNAPPDGRLGHTAIYDSARSRMIVFGGSLSSFVAILMNDVWELTLDPDPAWTEILPAGDPPFERLYHTSTYDPARDRMLVFGFTAAAEIWSLYFAGPPEWIEGVAPEVRWGAAAILEPVAGDLFTFGGAGGSGAFSDLWSLEPGATNGAWSEVVPAGSPPAARSGHSAVHVPSLGAMVVFGGTDGTSELGDVWYLSGLGTTGTSWFPVTPGGTPPAARHDHVAIFDSPRSRMLVFGGAAGPTLFLNDLWALDALGTPLSFWSPLATFGSPPSARADHAAVYDPSRDALIVFGGTDGASFFNDAHALFLGGSPGPTWAPLSPTGTPPAPRAGASAVYDPLRDRIVVFGGRDATTRFSEVWSLSLAGAPAWSPLVLTGSTPRSREGHVAVYDPARDRMLVFGGRDSSVIMNQASSLQWGGVVAVGVGGAPPRPSLVSPFAPNPATGAAQLSFEIPAPTMVRICIYDPSGRLVRETVDAVYPAGRHAAEWDGLTSAGTRAASGVYYGVVKLGSIQITRKLVLAR